MTTRREFLGGATAFAHDHMLCALARLRAKIEPDGGEGREGFRFIVTDPGVGYRFELP